MSELKPTTEESIQHFEAQQKRYVREHNGKPCPHYANAIEALHRAQQEHRGSKCAWPDGIEAKIHDIPVDTCVYTDRQRLHNVDITISECEKCGAIDISWSKNEDTEVIYEDADFVKRSRE